VRSLAKVTPQTISAFFSALRKRRPKSGNQVIADIRLFFDWLILKERRTKDNPVLDKIYMQRQSRRLPTPYSEAELRQIDALVKATADPRLELAVAIGLESGLRIAELCELRVSDVDLKGQRLCVRKSNRTGLERHAFFHKRVMAALNAWLDKRPTVDHDYLLTADKGAPLRKGLLRARLRRSLCGPGKLPVFSFQRLRCTAAARVADAMDTLSLMANLGWRTPGPVDQLRRLPSKESKAAYDHAMDEISNQSPQPEPRSESLEEYFTR